MEKVSDLVELNHLVEPFFLMALLFKNLCGGESFGLGGAGSLGGESFGLGVAVFLSTK